MNSRSKRWFAPVVAFVAVLAMAQGAGAATTCTSNAWGGGDWQENVWSCSNGSSTPPTGSTVVIAKYSSIKIDSNTNTVADVTISSGAKLRGNSGNTLSLTGNFTNYGKFSANSGTVAFVGTSQTITGNTTFYDLTVNADTLLTLAGNITVKGTTNLTAANLASTCPANYTVKLANGTVLNSCTGSGTGTGGGTSGSCGPIPIISSGTGPVFAGSKLEVSQNTKVNNGSYVNVNSGETSTNKVVPAAGGAPTTVEATLPPLQPATFPATSGDFTVPDNGSGSLTAPQYLNSLTVGRNSATLTLAPGDYYISDLTIDNDATIKISPAGKVRIFTDSNVSIGQNTKINVSPDTGDAGNFMLLLYGSADLNLEQNVAFVGIVYGPNTGSKVEIGQNSKIYGGIVVGGKAEIKENVELFYTSTIQAQLASASTCATSGSLDHVRLNHTGSGVTCVGSAVTVNACNGADSSGTCTANTSGLTGSVIAKSAAGVTLATVPFTIASGSSSVTVSVPVTTAQTVTFATSGLSATPTNATTCWDGSAASCSHVYGNAGFIFSDAANGAAVTISPQVAGTSSSTYYLRAVKTNTTTKACDAALTGANTVNFAYECNNPTTCSASNLMSINGGTSTVIGRNNNGNVVNSSYTPVSMTFDANGNAPFTFNFGDVGAVTLYASKAAGGNLLTALMGSSNSFVVAPASFAFSGITAGPIKAGNNFSATVTALTSTGAIAPNFGQEVTPESVTLSFVKYQPTGAGAVNGSFSGAVGAFSGGSATGNNLNWSEVGTIDLVATLASGSYLNSGLTATGKTGATGAVGRFIPDHFDVAVTQGCSLGSFTYSGQPFTVTVTAKNGLATPTTTLNYDGSANTTPNFAKAVTLSEASAAAGGLSSASVAASVFSAGVAVSATPAFTFTTALTAPATIKLRATDTDGVSSASGSEGTAAIRSGRLRIFNAFGSGRADLQLPMQAQYWSGASWVLNNNDSCTNLPANAFFLIDSAATGSSVNAAVAIAGGNGTLTLRQPASVGSVDVAANLGASGSDLSCLGAHGGTAAGLPWLRSQYGSCAAPFGRDPSARATFGIYSPETRRTIHVREQF